jgi:hypothetical protein
MVERKIAAYEMSRLAMGFLLEKYRFFLGYFGPIRVWARYGPMWGQVVVGLRSHVPSSAGQRRIW